MQKNLIDRFRGTFLGLAIGDALGMPFEGKDRTYVEQVWDKEAFLQRPGLSSGEWTDDTQLAIFHAEDLIVNGSVDVDYLSKRFVGWLKSGEAKRQGAGKTTCEAIKRMERGVPPERAGKTGKWAAGNGGAMRVAPLGLFYFNDLETLKSEVKKAVYITHNNLEAVNGAIAVAYVVSDAVKGNRPDWELFGRVAAFIGDCEVSERLKKIAEGEYGGLKSSAYVVDSVVLSIYCHVRFSDTFGEALRSAICWGGDTDTIAAMTGAMSGAYHGASEIPEKWIRGLNKSDFLIELADKLYSRAVVRGDGCGKGQS